MYEHPHKYDCIQNWCIFSMYLSICVQGLWLPELSLQV